MERKFKITIDGRQYDVTVEEQTEHKNVSYSEANSFPRAVPPAAFAPPAPAPVHAAPRGPVEAGDVVSPLGGVLESLLVTIGQEVSAGDRVAVVEAMKMKTPITAHQAGKVSAIVAKPGDGVEAGQVLVKLA